MLPEAAEEKRAYTDGKITNRLFSLSRRGGMTSWTDRAASSHANQEVSKLSLHWNYSNSCEGVRDEHVLEVIITEVMNTASGQWLTAINLPELMYLICILMIKFI